MSVIWITFPTLCAMAGSLWTVLPALRIGIDYAILHLWSKPK
jgi:hypothetical protein